MIWASGLHSRRADLNTGPECVWPCAPPFSRHAACSIACGQPRQAPVFRDLFRHCRHMADCAHRPRAVIGLRERWAGSAHWKCGWPRPPRKCARLKRFATRFSIREGSAIPNPARLFARRDIDGYDAICDHLLVIDHAARDRSALNRPAVVGTYRLLRQPLAEEYGGFYTAGEFDIGALDRASRTICNFSSSAALACFRLIATSAPSNFSGTASMHTSCKTNAM